MALSQVEKEQFGLTLVHQLSQTPYACASLKILGGGTANFLFRGVLAQLLPDGTETVVVKHTKGFVSANRNFELDVERCIYEEAMLNALHAFKPVPVENFAIRTPRLYHFDRETNAQILENLTDTIDLKTVLEYPDVSTILPASIATTMGHVLGVWLRSFHSWVSEPAQTDLVKMIADVVQKFPEIWEEKKKVLEEVRDMASAEYEKMSQDDDGRGWGIVHGDFWGGNILIPITPSLTTHHPNATPLFIIDWELTQFGRKAYDLGQLIGDLYERHHFFKSKSNADTALRLMQGFGAGYGALSDDEAFRVAIHAGQHLVCWYIRRDPEATFMESMEEIEGLVRIGTDWIVRGWERDREWFEGGELACLFRGG